MLMPQTRISNEPPRRLRIARQVDLVDALIKKRHQIHPRTVTARRTAVDLLPTSGGHFAISAFR